MSKLMKAPTWRARRRSGRSRSRTTALTCSGAAGSKCATEGGALDGDVDGWHPTPALPSRRDLIDISGKGLQQGEIARLVRIGFDIGEGRFAQEVDGVTNAVLRQTTQGWQRAGRRGAGDEAMGHRQHAAADGLRQHGPEDGLRGEHGGGAHRLRRGVSEVLAEVVGDRGGSAQRRENVHEAEEPHPEVRSPGWPDRGGVAATRRVSAPAAESRWRRRRASVQARRSRSPGRPPPVLTSPIYCTANVRRGHYPGDR